MSQDTQQHCDDIKGPAQYKNELKASELELRFNIADGSSISVAMNPIESTLALRHVVPGKTDQEL